MKVLKKLNFSGKKDKLPRALPAGKEHLK